MKKKITNLVDAKKIITARYGHYVYLSLMDSWFGKIDMSKINEICKKRAKIVIDFANKI